MPSNISPTYRTSPVFHPEYAYWAPQWEKIRDAEIGEIEIKRKREQYLPKIANHDKDQYEGFLRRAVFYNMTSRTLNALYGTVFRRTPKVTGLTPALKNKSSKITKEGMSLHLLAKTTIKEVLAVGRYGMLVDASPDGRGNPYIACYTAENIIDWEMGEVNGQWQLVRVILREIYTERSGHWAPHEYKARFRILLLDDTDAGYIYTQLVYNDVSITDVPDVNQVPSSETVPTVRGKALDHIPFVVVGPFTNSPDVQKPPIMDIVTLNFSHYLSYALLEHSRFYTASPTYWVQNESTETPGEYTVGPDSVWILGKGEQAGILEFNGHGLRSLELALSQKEGQIASIGGRMMPGSSRGAAESDNSLLMQERNEQTLLLNLSDTGDEALTQVLHWWADWNNASSAVINKISFELNRDFLIKDVGAREFRAIHQMYADGILPVDVVYDYLKRAEVIPEWMEEDEYVALLGDSKQFPNMVDVLAKMQMFPDAKSFHEYKMAKEQTAADSEEVVGNSNDPKIPGIPEQAKSARRLK